MYNIIVAEDHPIFKDGLNRMFEREVDLHLKDEVDTAEELINKLMQNADYDLVITDVGLPGRSGIDILPEIKKINPKLPVLVLSMFDEGNVGVRAIKAGADAYLSKESKPVEIINAIRIILSGRKFITPSIAEKLALEATKDFEKAPHEKLSNREFEVMRLIALGKTVKEIGDTLSLSINTVNTYRSRIFEKMGIESNIDLARYVFENKLFD